MADHEVSHLLGQMGVLFLSGAVTAYVCNKFRIPSVLGFILIGVLLGPSAFNVVQGRSIGFLSELGIIFLLFLVGLELSLAKIKRLKTQAPLAGILQLTFAGAALTTLFTLAGIPLQLAFLFGSILALSSTAIVLKRLEEQRELETLHGRVILAILIIQDMAIIPLMTLIAALSTPLNSKLGLDSVLFPMLLGIGKALLVAVVMMVLSLKLLPKLVDRLASNNQKEISLLVSLAIALCSAWITNALGISYEAGALIAGISLSGTLFSHQMFADSRAFRDVFVMLFFVSMGLWVDFAYVAVHWPLVLALTLLILVIKSLTTYGAVRLAGFHHQNALWAALALFQVGEFSFVALTHMAKLVQKVPVWEPFLNEWAPLINNSIVVTMFITPLLIQAAPWLVKKVSLVPPEQAALEVQEEAKTDDTPQVLIAGYGPVAQQLTRALKYMNLPYCLIEMNARTVKVLQAAGEPCLYGDASNADILKTAGIEKASFLILTFPDIKASEAAIQQATTINPDIKTLVRARYLMDVPRLVSLGASNIVCEEFETSLDFVATLMRSRQAKEREIDLMIETLRMNAPEEVNQAPVVEEKKALAFGRGNLKDSMKIEWLTLAEESPLVGQTVAQSRIRQESGVTILSVLGALDQRQQDPWPDYVFVAGDTLIVIGTWEQLKRMEALAASEH